MTYYNPEFFNNTASEMLGQKTKSVLSDLGGYEDMIKEIDKALDITPDTQTHIGDTSHGNIV